MPHTKPTMRVFEALDVAEACFTTFRNGELPRIAAMPMMHEALAVLCQHVHCLKSQLNITKDRLQETNVKIRVMRGEKPKALVKATARQPV